MKISPHPKIEPGLTLRSGHVIACKILFVSKKIEKVFFIIILFHLFYIGKN
jgi:hypothetical protein